MIFVASLAALAAGDPPMFLVTEDEKLACQLEVKSRVVHPLPTGNSQS